MPQWWQFTYKWIASSHLKTKQQKQDQSICQLIYLMLNHSQGPLEVLSAIKEKINYSLQSKREATVARKNFSVGRDL